MPIRVSVREMKDTAKFGKLVEESNGPAIVTRNGRDAYVVMTAMPTMPSGKTLRT